MNGTPLGAVPQGGPGKQIELENHTDTGRPPNPCKKSRVTNSLPLRLLPLGSPQVRLQGGTFYYPTL